MSQVSVSSYSSLPQQPGVYLFLDSKGVVLYVGKAKNLKNRVSSYFTNSKDLGEKTRILISQAKKIKYFIVESEIESLLLEANLVKKFQPKYNIRLTDDKSYPLIEITLGDEYPKVLYVRRMTNDKSLYFGPFPSPKDIKLVLRTVRRIFPFESVKNHPKRLCLYHHLGLCPCGEYFSNPEVKKEYKKTIKQLTGFMEGNSKKISKELEKERDTAAREEDFEKAKVLQKRIDAINVVTHPVNKPFDYEVNPNLRHDLRFKELETLKNILNEHGLPVKSLDRIECYDISNTQGSNATASLVVFTNGEKDSQWYRRFKIYNDGKPNDFASMQQVLRRRLNHKEWPKPDLIIVDGGKGQVSSASEILKHNPEYLPHIGLAKRFETIVLPTLEEIKLPDRSPSLHLLMRIRDEAHRFAITYHKKLRSKNALQLT